MARKGVLLRFEPEMLARVDQARAALTRQEWLMTVIEFGVHRAEAVETVVRGQERTGPTHMLAGAERTGPRHPIVDPNEGDLELSARPSSDGSLEIYVEPSATDTPPEQTGLDGGSAEHPGRLPADAEGSDTGSATLVEEP